MYTGKNRVSKTTGVGERRKTTHKTIKIKDKVKTVTSRTTILDINEGFLPGNYSYPISFPVPQNVAGTYAYSSSGWGLDTKCSSSYMVYAEILEQSSKRVIGRAGAPIVIMQRPRMQLTQSVEMNLSAPLVTWFCINRGTFDGKFVFEKNIVCMDETVWMKFYLDNTKSNLSVDDVTCYLKRTLEIRTRKGQRKIEKKTMIKQSVPG